MTTGAAFHRGSSVQDYQTPTVFLDPVKKRFGLRSFAWDLAADAYNSKADRYLGERENSLSVEWANLKGDCWLNPPFSSIAPWAQKCHGTRRQGAIFLLVPAAVGSNWFAQFVHGSALVLALNGRLSFDGKAPYPKDCLLACYGLAPGFEVWRWQ